MPQDEFKRIRFEFRNDGCVFQETTEQHPGLSIEANFAYLDGDEIHLNLGVRTPSDVSVGSIEDTWRDHPHVSDLHKTHEASFQGSFHVAYSWEDSVIPVLVEHNPIELEPMWISGSTQEYEVTGRTGDIQDLLQAFEDRGSVRIQRSEPLDRFSPTEETEQQDPTLDRLLSQRQLEALLLAHREGYYSWPRDLSGSDLADKMGLSPSTFHEHLRRAEARVLGEMIAEYKEEDPSGYEALLRVLRDLDDASSRARGRA